MSFQLRLVTVILVTAVFLLAVPSFALWPRKEGPQYSYIGDDFPRVWDIGPLGQVRMVVEDTHRYQLDTAQGDADWSNLIPGGNGVIHLGPEDREFSVSMLHQLKCLGIIGTAAVKRTLPLDGDRSVIRHCMNYMRQMVLCRSDTYLENTRDPYGPRAVPIDSVRTCQDWTRVYEAVEKNQESRSHQYPELD